MERDTKAFDIAILPDLRHATEGDARWNTALKGVMLDVTALGDDATLVIVVAMISGVPLLAHEMAAHRRRICYASVTAAAYM